jgi:hypothetical protein
MKRKLDKITKNANLLRDYFWEGTEKEKQLKYNQYIVKMRKHYNKEYK